jgi:hypothetical protein
MLLFFNCCTIYLFHWTGVGAGAIALVLVSLQNFPHSMWYFSRLSRLGRFPGYVAFEEGCSRLGRSRLGRSRLGFSRLSKCVPKINMGQKRYQSTAYDLPFSRWIFFLI